MEGAAASSSIVLKLQVLQKIHIFFISPTRVLSQHLFSNLSSAETRLLFMTNSNWMERSRSNVEEDEKLFAALDRVLHISKIGQNSLFFFALFLYAEICAKGGVQIHLH